jgi:vitamin B12 transporter
MISLATRAVPLLLAGLLLAPPCTAQSRQPTVVVTASRTPISADAALAAVTVIEREAIEASGSLDLVSLLRTTVGLDIARGGGPGQQTSLFLGGSASNQLLVLVDGIRVASTNTGAYAWERLSLAQVERIEIVRGPRAALYGSDAIGGVVQVFTRRASGASGALGVGSHGTRLGEAGLGAERAGGRAGLRVAYAAADGFSAQNPRGFSYDPDADGYRQRSIAADSQHAIGDLRLELQARAAEQDVEFDIGRSQGNDRQGRATLAGGGGASDWQLAASNARETLDTPAFFNRFESRRRQLDWQHGWRPRAGAELLWGLTAVDERGASIDTFAAAPQYAGDRALRAAFASWRDGRGGWRWELAGRHDDYRGHAGASTAQAALGWLPNADHQLRLGAGEGFRAPNLNELYSPGFGGLFAGNPALRPERSRAFELGGEHRLGGWQLGWRGFRNEVRDLVDFSGGDRFQAINLGRARLQGLETEFQRDFGALTLAGNASWLQARERPSGQPLLRRPPRKANLRLERRAGAGLVAVELHALSARPELGGELPGHALLSAFVRWPLHPRLDLDLRLENLTDRRYELVRGFDNAGIGGLLQLRWQAGR